MKYLVSGIIGFFLTLLVSLPFQNVIKVKEAKAFAMQLRSKSDRSADMDVTVKPIVRTDDRKDEPKIKFMPQYPAKAAADKIEGFVTLSFKVSKDGSVQNVKVTESSPPQVFDEAAIDAVSKWSFAEKESKKPSQKLRLYFSLGQTVAVEQRAE
ncbi:MAG: energy transducer TonB [Proteobacteria bacterium]|nr:MAG: energy transducer TonB [Pseudomonadota bacterium]